MDEITISKGNYSLTVYAETIAENYSNKIFQITPAKTIANQSEGAETSKIVDLLRITHQMVIKGYITGTSEKTAKQVKSDLINIFKGGGINGGSATLEYDCDSFKGYIEKINIIEKPMDKPSNLPEEIVRYEVSITFLEGEQV